MKTIIVPTDFSPDASKAYEIAGHIAKQADTEIILLHIISSHLDFIGSLAFGSYGTNALYEKDPKMEIDEATKALDELVQSDIFRGIKITYFISQSFNANPLKEVLEFLNKHEHSLVVMGTSGDDFGGDSNAEFIVRKSTIPVLTIRKELKEINIRKILFPTDFKTVDLRFMHRINTIADIFGASIEFVYINTPKHFKNTEYIEKEWRRFKNKYKIRRDNFSVYADHEVEMGIIKMVERSEADLLALPTHGRTGLEHLFGGSYTEDIVNEISIPVYSYNMKNDYHPNRYRTVVETRGFTG